MDEGSFSSLITNPCWALTLSQYDYSIEYRRTSEHGNADALSRLPVGEDVQFDKEQEAADISTVCTIKTLSQQLNPTDAGILVRESRKDPILSAVADMLKRDGLKTSSQKTFGIIRN